MWGISTHVSDPKSNTDCTTALENIPDTLRLAPSHPRILVSRTQLFRNFFKFPTTAGQLLSPTVNNCPEYFKKVTVSSGITKDWKALSALS